MVTKLVVPLACDKLREGGNKIRIASRREVLSDIGLKLWQVPIPYEE